MRAITLGLALAGFVWTQSLPGAQASEIDGLLAKQCSECHQLAPPADRSLANRRQRKGPPLYFAGDKFRKDWLVSWLQNPTRIRPAGDYPPAHITAGADGDVIDPASLIEHPVLAAAAAEQAAESLAAMTPNQALIAAEAFEQVSLSKRMGELDFVKFKGCGSCHKDTKKYGGVSGPELYTAWRRLRPEFITSYIRDPSAWEPRSLMPNQHLQTGAINKLANYIKLIEIKMDSKP